MGSRRAVGGSADPFDADALGLEGLKSIASKALANSYADTGKTAADCFQCCLASIAYGIELHFSGAESLTDCLDVHEQNRLRGRSKGGSEGLPSDDLIVAHP